MSFETARMLVGLFVALALMQQAAEHVFAARRGDRILFAARAALSLPLAAGAAPGWAALALVIHSLRVLQRHDGPYNGGADRMTLLCLICLAAAHLAPEPRWRELALGYLAVQVTLSYVMSGWVKIVNPDWRSGRALADVFAFSAYPVDERLRGLADRRRLLCALSWAVILLELLFPLGFLHPAALIVVLAAAAAFHLANACLFGLNRFFWAWIATYPSLLWLQDRLVGTPLFDGVIHLQ